MSQQSLPSLMLTKAPKRTTTMNGSNRLASDIALASLAYPDNPFISVSSIYSFHTPHHILFRPQYHLGKMQHPASFTMMQLFTLEALLAEQFSNTQHENTYGLKNLYPTLGIFPTTSNSLRPPDSHFIFHSMFSLSSCGE